MYKVVYLFINKKNGKEYFRTVYRKRRVAPVVGTEKESKGLRMRVVEVVQTA